MAVISLVLGFFSLVCFWALGVNLIISIIGLVLGIVCLAGKYPQQTMGIIGLVLSVAGLVFGIGFTCLYIFAVI